MVLTGINKGSFDSGQHFRLQNQASIRDCLHHCFDSADVLKKVIRD